MNPNKLILSQTPGWYRRILHLFWLLFAFTMLLEAIHLILHPERWEQMVRRFLILQGIGFLAVLAALEGISLVRAWRTDYTLISGCTALITLLAVFHRDIVMIPVLFLSPVFIAVLTFRKNRILFAILTAAPSFVCLLALLPGFGIREHPGSLATFCAFFLSVTGMAYWTVARGEEMLRTLEDANLANQELMVKNIIMDKLFKLDALTELYNHKTFHEYLEKLIEQSEANGLPLQLAIIDLDNFKKVNDTYGHRVGDNVLMRTAAVLRQAVTPNDFVARYGGEEFAIIFTEKSLKESYRVVERIRSEMENLLHEELGFRPVTCSIGLEEYKKGSGKEYWFMNTDASLYAAKKRGKNQISSTDLPLIMGQEG